MATPASPDDAPVREDRRLVDEVDFDVEPIRLSPLYSAGLLVVAVTMLLLPVLYVGLVLLVGFGVWYWATHGWVIMTDGGAMQARMVAYLAPIIAGSLGALFMVKPLFAPAPRGPDAWPVSRDDEALLYAYVDRLCATLGAPAPSRIDVDMQVNASARFRRGLGSFLGEDLVLTLGLPLTAGMTLGQWTGVLAHEFGHFTQGAAMRFTYVIGSVNHWFARVVYERDAWDERLERWLHETDSGWIQVIFYVAKAFIWVSRRILWMLMMVGLTVSSFLSRQMEFSADLYQARVSGSELFRATHLRLPVLSIAWTNATNYVGEMWRERRLVDDVVGLHLAEVERLTESEDVGRQIEESMASRKTGVFDTHPATSDRIAAVTDRTLPARMDDPEAASCVFRDFGDLCRAQTLRFYEGVLGAPIDPGALVPLDDAVAEQTGRIEKARALGQFFFGGPLVELGVFLPADGPAPGDGEAASPAELRLSQQESAPAVVELMGRLDEAARRVRMAQILLRASDAGIRLTADHVGLTEEDADDPEGTMESASAQLRELTAALTPHAAVAADRAATGLALATGPAARPASPDSDQLLASLPRLRSALGALGAQWERMRRMQGELAELTFLLQAAGPRLEPGPLADQIFELFKSLRGDLVQIEAMTGSLPYPYEHADGETPLGSYLVGAIPEVGFDIGPAASECADRFGRLYYRIWSDLAALVLDVERALGPPPLDDVDEAGGVRDV